MQRDDVVFTIGYKGNAAIIDKKLRAKYRSLSTVQLYEKGLLKPAVASAIYERENGNVSELEQLLGRFKTDFGEEMDEQKLRRIYGIATDNKSVPV